MPGCTEVAQWSGETCTITPAVGYDKCWRHGGPSQKHVKQLMREGQATANLPAAEQMRPHQTKPYPLTPVYPVYPSEIPQELEGHSSLFSILLRSIRKLDEVQRQSEQMYSQNGRPSDYREFDAHTNRYYVLSRMVISALNIDFSQYQRGVDDKRAEILTEIFENFLAKFDIPEAKKREARQLWIDELRAYVVAHATAMEQEEQAAERNGDGHLTTAQ